MENIWRRIERVSYLTGYLAGWVLLGIVALTIVEVLTRYILHQPLILCDEFGGYSLLAISFLGLAYCAKEKGHIRITFVVERLSADAAGKVRLVTLSLALLYAGAASKVSWDFLISSFQRGIRSNSWLMTPVYWPQMVIPIGFTLLTLVLIREMGETIRVTRSRSKREETGGAVF
jgi:TRAP-type C4-dicarboxylate transport system permease small subunit